MASEDRRHFYNDFLSCLKCDSLLLSLCYRKDHSGHCAIHPLLCFTKGHTGLEWHKDEWMILGWTK